MLLTLHMRLATPVVLTSLLFVLSGCDDLGDFKTDGDVFRGQVIGAGSEVFRRGISPQTYLELEFDPDLAEGRGEDRGPPGYLHTYVCEDGDSGCANPELGPITHTALEPFPVLDNDVLSDYTFPGAGRLRNYIMSARLSEADSGSAMVFVSLMEHGGIEVRLLAPGAEPGAEGLFGVFPLARQDP